MVQCSTKCSIEVMTNAKHVSLDLCIFGEVSPSLGERFLLLDGFLVKVLSRCHLYHRPPFLVVLTILRLAAMKQPSFFDCENARRWEHIHLNRGESD